MTTSGSAGGGGFGSAKPIEQVSLIGGPPVEIPMAVDHQQQQSNLNFGVNANGGGGGGFVIPQQQIQPPPSTYSDQQPLQEIREKQDLMPPMRF